MTNTHINVGGHKITTNKVGATHNIKSSIKGGATCDSAEYCVINGTCFVKIWGLQNSDSNEHTIFSNMPTPKFNGCCYAFCGSSCIGFLYVQNNGDLNFTAWTINTKTYNYFSYAVADDWVESTTSSQSMK